MESKVKVYRIKAILALVLALATLIPMGASWSVNLAGFHTLCSFTPISTIFLLGAAMNFRFRIQRIRAWQARIAQEENVHATELAAA